MAEVETQYNLYDFNKVNMARLPELDFHQENSAKDILRTFFLNHSENRYFMMLCHDNHDFTLFDREQWDLRDIVGAISNDIIECMHNRQFGIIDIVTVAGAVEIWVKPHDQTEVAYMYMLFPYDNGVITY